MIIYDERVNTFVNQCLFPGVHSIGDIIAELMKLKAGLAVTKSEIDSWNHSLPEVAKALQQAGIDDQCGVGVEYKIRLGKGRIDCLIYGLDDNNKKNLVVIELKQWSSVGKSGKPNHVFAVVGASGPQDKCHPSIQANGYVDQLKNFYKYVQDEDLGLHSCSYLHNMPQINEVLLLDASLFPIVTSSPAFLHNDVQKLISFIKKYVKKPCDEILYQIDHSDIKPSAHLSKALKEAIEGNDFFAYDEDQENAISEILFQVTDSLYYGDKRVIIIKGAPGTGKSVVAMNVLGKLIAPKKGKKYNAAYFAVNAAIRTLYGNELVKDDYKRNFLKTLFKYPTCLKDAGADTFDCGIFDESHRLFDFKGGVGMSKGTHLLEKAINACRVSVFFVDGDQTVTSIDYGTESNIKAVAAKLHVKVIESDDLVLTTQFRCIGGSEYLTFIRNFLGYENNRNIFDLDKYEFEVKDTAKEVMDIIKKKDLEFQEQYIKAAGKLVNDHSISGRCRVVAGYTHNWVSKKQDRDGPDFDFDLDNHTFKAKWNLRCAKYGPNYSWLDDPLSTEEIGCIHTVQGLDLNYCGVIIGKDLRYDKVNKKLIFDKTMNAKTDTASQIKNVDDATAERLIRNTYNVLLSRGMKGTFVYCEDPDLQDYLKTHFTFKKS